MILLIGLGNPGEKYINTPHNCGVAVLRYLTKNNTNITLYETTIFDIKCLILLHPNYMNISGPDIVKVMNYYSINVDNIIVIHDDIDLELGKYKEKEGHGSGGHNGLRSLNNALGNNQKYCRIRIGVGRSNNSLPIKDFVLQKFNTFDINILEKTFNSKDFMEFVKKLLIKKNQ